jgi:hypothetical protein
MSYSWLDEMINFGHKYILQDNHLYDLDDEKKARKLSDSLEKCWQAELLRNNVRKDDSGCYVIHETSPSQNHLFLGSIFSRYSQISF